MNVQLHAHACVRCLAESDLRLRCAVLEASYGGEDAYFASDVGGGALGVADGVGGWADSEINPAGAGPAGGPRPLRLRFL